MSMQVISIINLKGGVGKTMSSINIAHILATAHDKKVLLIDNDSQSNTTKLFNLYDEEEPSISDIMNESVDIEDVIVPTQYKNLDLIPANMSLLKANEHLIKNSSSFKGMILRNALEKIEGEYDYCVIDNSPGINISVINALISSNDVLIPIKIDKFAFDGMKELMDQIENAKKINPGLKLIGCFVTQFSRNKVNQQGEEFLNNQAKYPMFKSHIRKTVKIDESSFESKPILECSKRYAAAKDYLELVEEYLKIQEV
ncbi:MULTISPECIES: ParA family protein [unclassified Clostridium]|uniref:ParA family protein n=1 Tax=unclassified Clostridium TaxID=2614128 RepID=UPI00029733BE|nr:MULTISPECIES: ParA family protein [unclassified Clostridium]EKQ50294.1 MAG: ATPase involved in chromosome partitioning [Clostridium sp. Maddingley MBC34-26]